MITGAWIDDSGLLNIEADEETHSMDVMALASWGSLLGYDDVLDTIEAILRVRVRGTEPDVSPSGENVWTESYGILQLREEAREDEAQRAIEEGTRDDPRSPQLRGAMAARAAVLGATGATKDSDSVLVKCRDNARARLGCACPAKESITARVAKRPSTDAKPRTVENHGATAFMTDQEREALQPVAKELAPLVAILQSQFLHGLTGRGEDPVGDTPTPRDDDPSGVDSIIDRYRQDPGDDT